MKHKWQSMLLTSPPWMEGSSRQTASVPAGTTISSCWSLDFAVSIDVDRLLTISFKTRGKDLLDVDLLGDSFSCLWTRWFSISLKSVKISPHEQWACPLYKTTTWSRSLSSSCNNSSLLDMMLAATQAWWKMTRRMSNPETNIVNDSSYQDAKTYLIC